jgi:hypothetical protein
MINDLNFCCFFWERIYMSDLHPYTLTPYTLEKVHSINEKFLIISSLKKKSKTFTDFKKGCIGCMVRKKKERKQKKPVANDFKK